MIEQDLNHPDMTATGRLVKRASVGIDGLCKARITSEEFSDQEIEAPIGGHRNAEGSRRAFEIFVAHVGISPGRKQQFDDLAGTPEVGPMQGSCSQVTAKL